MLRTSKLNSQGSVTNRIYFAASYYQSHELEEFSYSLCILCIDLSEHMKNMLILHVHW